MLKELIAMIYNSKEHRIRGSFITAAVTVAVWFINFSILFLVFHQVYYGYEKLAALAVFVSIWLGFVKAAYVYITTTYMNNKSAIEMVDKKNQQNVPEPNRAPAGEAGNDVPVDTKNTMYEK